MRETGRGNPDEELNKSGYFSDPRKGHPKTELGRKLSEGRISEIQKEKELAGFVAQIDNIEKTYGLEAVQIIAQYLAVRNAGNRNDQELFEKAKELTDLEWVSREIFSGLKKKGIVQELEDGTIVLDKEKFQNLPLEQFPYESHLRRRKGGVTKSDLVYYALRDRKGIAGDEIEGYKQGTAEARDLIYIPDNEDSAFDPEKIKQSKFVIMLGEESGNVHLENRKYPTKSGKSLNFESVQLATLLYHPQYGDGYRDESGKLLLRDPKTREYRPITHNLVRAYGFIGSGKRKKESFLYGSVSYLRNKTPELLKYDLLRESDFRSISGQGDRPMLKEVGTRGVVMINGVLHYLGRNLEGRGVVQIMPGLGGVLEEKDGETKLSHTFQIQSRGPELRKGKLKAGVKWDYAGPEKTGIAPFNPDQFFQKRLDESDQAYAERVKPLKNFEKILQFGTELYRATGIKLEDFSLEEQVYLSAAADKLQERKNEILEFVKRFGADGIRTFLALEHGLEHGERILEIARRLPPEQAQEIFQLFTRLTETARDRSEEILNELQDKFSALTITRENIANALTARGRDLLNETYFLIAAGKQDRIPELTRSLRLESGKELVLRSEFMKVTNLLSKTDVRLSQYEQEQKLALAALQGNPSRQAMYLRSLETLERLAPIPEIHWRVDRSIEEYNRRLGIDLEDFLSQRARQKPDQKLLEIGPGSGVSRKERSRTQALNYEDFALSDKVYYPLAPVIEKLLDFDKIENAVGAELPETEKRRLTDFIYKAVVIREGQTGLDNFQYNTKNLKRLSEDVNNLKEILVELEEYFGRVETVPDNISTRDEYGNVIYPYKINARDQSKLFRKAKQAISSRISEFLIDGWQTRDLHELLPVYPPNVMIGNIQDIKRLAPNQVDVELGVRSTVYTRGEKYVEFLKNLASRLADGGAAIDDSIRDNDGWYYRFAEVMRAEKESGERLEILLVTGPGFPGEDLRQEKVPLAMIITKNGSSRELVGKHLLAGCEIQDLEKIIRDEQYLRSLDRSGLTYERVRETLAPPGVAKVA